MGGGGGLCADHLIAGLHTRHDDGNGRHGVKRLKGERHLVLQVGNKLFENATSRLICFARSRMVALGQGGMGLLFLHILYDKHNIEEL